jgi:hypothetical protein
LLRQKRAFHCSLAGQLPKSLRDLWRSAAKGCRRSSGSGGYQILFGEKGIYLTQ